MPAFTSGVKVVSGLHIAKATVHYSKEERVRDAALWLRGEVAVAPTLRLAANVFRISVPLLTKVHRQLERLERRVHANGNGGSTTMLSDDVVERIVAEVGVERIWRALDKLTQPQLPLQAAE
jgi:hypothetical protein